MNREPLLPPDIWERVPPEAQVYIRALEARVAALEATVQQVREQLQQTCRTSSRPPSSDPPQAWPSGRGARPQGVDLEGNPGTRDTRGSRSLSSRWP